MKKKIIIAGGTGFLGQSLKNYFNTKGFEIVIFTRGKSKYFAKAKYCNWDAKNLGPWAKELEGAEAVINLTGKCVDCRYTETAKKQIADSRIDSTKILGEAIANCNCFH